MFVQCDIEAGNDCRVDHAGSCCQVEALVAAFGSAVWLTAEDQLEFHEDWCSF